MNAGAVRGARRRLIFLRDRLRLRRARDAPHRLVQWPPPLRMLYRSTTHGMTLSIGSIGSEDISGHVLLTRLLNSHWPEENIWPLKNKAIQPRLIESASSEESHRLMQKNQGMTSIRLRQPRIVPSAWRVFESAFRQDFRRRGAAASLVHSPIGRAFITLLSLQGVGRRSPLKER